MVKLITIFYRTRYVKYITKISLAWRVRVSNIFYYAEVWQNIQLSALKQPINRERIKEMVRQSPNRNLRRRWLCWHTYWIMSWYFYASNEHEMVYKLWREERERGTPKFIWIGSGWWIKFNSCPYVRLFVMKLVSQVSDI